MIIKLLRQTDNLGSKTILETRQNSADSFMKFLEMEFGDLDQAFEYVGKHYGEGNFLIEAHRNNGTFIGKQEFTVFNDGSLYPGSDCDCPVAILMVQGCQCGGD